MRTLPAPIYKLLLLIVLYPWFLKLFYLGNIGEVNKWLSSIAIILAFFTPIYSLYVSIKLGSTHANNVEKSQRIFALMGSIVPSLFTLIGVILYMLGMGMTAELVVYYVFWALAALVLLKPTACNLSAVKLDQNKLRFAHGISSLLLLLFIAAHLFNHLSANWGGETHIQIMEILRVFYRSSFIEPILFAALIFQVTTGLMLISKHVGGEIDGYRTTQLSTGLLLVVFLASHVTAVLALGRGFLGIDTNWDWLVAAPGLLEDPWNVRLVVHYALGVFALLVHVLLGVRVVISAHQGTALANKVFWGLVSIPFVMMFFVMRPLLLA